MNTHNVNVNTATPESPKTWAKTPESVYFTCKIFALTELAQSEMLFYRALSRLGLEPADPDAEMDAPVIALDNMERLDEMGAINTLAVYELVQDVSELIKTVAPDLPWDVFVQLEQMQSVAAEIKALYMNGIKETLTSEDKHNGRGKSRRKKGRPESALNTVASCNWRPHQSH